MINVMITLLALVAAGYVCGKLGYLDAEFDRRLSRLVINVTCPALILSSAMTGTLPDRRYILPLLLVSVITYAVLTAAAFILPRLLIRPVANQGVAGFAMMFGNVGFMGYPVVASLFGHEAVFYAAVLNVVNTFAVFTIGTILVAGRGVEGERFQKKVLYSTPMLAAYLTMAIVAFEVGNMPEWVSCPLTMLGDVTVPAALLIVGSSMARLPRKAMLGNSAVYATSVCRLLFLPVVVYYLTLLLRFDHFVAGINMVVVAMPVATYGTILCLKYDKDTTFMAEVTFITTLLSMLTIPALVSILGV